MHQLVAEDGSNRKHRPMLRYMLESNQGPVRIASAYVTVADLAWNTHLREARFLTSLLRYDVVSGATSLEALKRMIEAGVQCRSLAGGARLHAKVYLVGHDSAFVTSANLTMNGLDRNLEVGVRLAGASAQELAAWFDRLWVSARPLDLEQIAEWLKETAALRRQFVELERKTNAKSLLPSEAIAPPLDNGPPSPLAEHDFRGGIRKGKRRMVGAGSASLWEDYMRHRRPPLSDREATQALNSAETSAAELSRRIGNRSVYIFAYRFPGRAVPVRLSIGINDPPLWPRPERGSAERVSIWRDGARLL